MNEMLVQHISYLFRSGDLKFADCQDIPSTFVGLNLEQIEQILSVFIMVFYHFNLM